MEYMKSIWLDPLLPWIKCRSFINMEIFSFRIFDSQNKSYALIQRTNFMWSFTLWHFLALKYCYKQCLFTQNVQNLDCSLFMLPNFSMCIVSQNTCWGERNNAFLFNQAKSGIAVLPPQIVCSTLLMGLLIEFSKYWTPK